MKWTRIFRGLGQCALTPPSRKPMLRIELLEDRNVPAAIPFAPNGFGGGDFVPFPGFTGQTQPPAAMCNGDGTADIIVAQGVGNGSRLPHHDFRRGLDSPVVAGRGDRMTFRLFRCAGGESNSGVRRRRLRRICRLQQRWICGGHNLDGEPAATGT